MLLIAYGTVRLFFYVSDWVSAQRTTQELREIARETDTTEKTVSISRTEPPALEVTSTLLPSTPQPEETPALSVELPVIEYPNGYNLVPRIQKLRKRSEYIIGWITMNNLDEEDADAWHKMSEKLIGEFTKIANLGMSEYEYMPPKKYFRDGFNLCKRMKTSPEEYTLFLKDPSVPPTNNLAERCARKYKRKAHQMMSFRGDYGDEYFCDVLSILETLRLRKLNLFKEISSRFALQ